MRRFPFSTFPSGWYQVGWGAELAPGAVKPLRYFAEDLVAFRSDSGKVQVLDAYCGHLGAHMGYGGRVAGENLASQIRQIEKDITIWTHQRYVDPAGPAVLRHRPLGWGV